jgi:uncharacterized protein YegJ (DUF2314 family)
MPQLKATFLAGLRPGERLLVKSPFSAEGGTEYMWIEVTRWDDRGIAGLLMGEPRAVKSLRSGQAVVVRESDFYDYVLERPGGESEGNETGKLLEARAKR